MSNKRIVQTSVFMLIASVLGFIGVSQCEEPSLSSTTSTTGSGFYENALTKFIYPPGILHLEVISESEVVFLASLTGVGNPIESVPRIDILSVSTAGFSGTTITELSKDGQAQILEPLTTSLVASYYGVVMDDAGMLPDVGLNMTYLDIDADFTSTSVSGEAVVKVDPYGTIPESIIRVQLSGDDTMGVISSVFMPDGISEESQILLDAVFDSIQYTGGIYHES